MTESQKASEPSSASATDITILCIEDEPEMIDLFRVILERKGYRVVGAVGGQEGLDALVLFGMGGIFVEALKDVVFRLAPLSEREADEMLTGVRALPILEGVRGQPGVDFDRLRECLIRLSWLVKDFGFIDEMDLNPVLAYPAGDGAAVVDVRMKVAAE